jgi:hypothetical protein
MPILRYVKLTLGLLSDEMIGGVGREHCGLPLNEGRGMYIHNFILINNCLFVCFALI